MQLKLFLVLSFVFIEIAYVESDIGIKKIAERKRRSVSILDTEKLRARRAIHSQDNEPLKKITERKRRSVQILDAEKLRARRAIYSQANEPLKKITERKRRSVQILDTEKVRARRAIHQANGPVKKITERKRRSVQILDTEKLRARRAIHDSEWPIDIGIKKIETRKKRSVQILDTEKIRTRRAIHKAAIPKDIEIKKAETRKKRSVQILDTEKIRTWRAIHDAAGPIGCDTCHPETVEECPVPGSLLWILDRQTSAEDPERALHSLPPGFTVKESSIPGAGLGVWTLQDIPACTLLGPYVGTLVSMQSQSSGSYAWQVLIAGKGDYLVDAQDKSQSNWMRYVNCPNLEHEQNVVAFQFEGEIFYRTYKPIPAGTELLVWYGEVYANELRRMRDRNVFKA